MDLSPPNFRDQRRDRIIDVARQVFFESGYANATMSMISERLGGSKATLYAYFKSKEDLFAAIIQEQCTCLKAVQRPELISDDIRATLIAIGRELLRSLLSDQTVRTHQLVIEEVHSNPALAEQLHAYADAQARASAIPLLAEANRRGLLFTPDFDEARRVFAANLFGKMQIERLLGIRRAPDDADIARQAELAVDVFLAYYGPDGAAARAQRAS